MTPRCRINAKKLYLLAGVASVGVCLAADPGTAPKTAAPAAPAPDAKEATEFAVPPPPFSKDIFPCTSCHNQDLPPNKTRRELSAHDEIKLKHDEEHRWCLDCHNAENRDTLRSASGEPIKFEESYKLCGQCHGDKYRDWKAGVHGKRSGEWNGRKTYLLCVNCHNPHAPKFKPIAPMPPPARPESRP